jgi:glycosyltransferase involved in cell wall biosynthesis
MVNLNSPQVGKSLRVWIYQSGEPLHQDKSGMRPMRAMNLADELLRRGHQVTIWSSRFDHFTHLHRSEKLREISPQLEIRLINSPGYRRNLGFGRLIDHAILAINLKSELRKHGPPDVAFIGYPPIETAWVIKEWLKKKSVPYVIDVKDMWPHIFVSALPAKLHRLAKLLLTPYFKMMRSTLTEAKSICSISEPFLNWAQNQTFGSRDRSFDAVAHLTSSFKDNSKEDEADFDFWLAERVPNYETSNLISFVGSISPTFNFNTIIKLARDRQDIKFAIAGGGSQYEELRRESIDISNIFWLGWISAAQANFLISKSLACIAPYRDDMEHGFELSIPNKIFDAMQVGKPILLSGGGYKKSFVENNGIGITYPSNDSKKLAEAIDYLQDSKTLTEKLGSKSKELYEREFSAYTVYEKLAKRLEEVAVSNSESS